MARKIMGINKSWLLSHLILSGGFDKSYAAMSSPVGQKLTLRASRNMGEAKIIRIASSNATLH